MKIVSTQFYFFKVKAESGGNVLQHGHAKLFSCCCSHVLASAYLLLKRNVCALHVLHVSPKSKYQSEQVVLLCGNRRGLLSLRISNEGWQCFSFLVFEKKFPQYRAWLRYSHCWYSTSESAFKHRHRETDKGRNVSSSMPCLRVCHSSGTQSGQHISLAVCLIAEQTCR